MCNKGDVAAQQLNIGVILCNIPELNVFFKSFFRHVDQAFSPAQSYRSMTSDDNAINISQEDGSPTRYKQVKVSKAQSINPCIHLCLSYEPSDIPHLVTFLLKMENCNCIL